MALLKIPLPEVHGLDTVDEAVQAVPLAACISNLPY